MDFPTNNTGAASSSSERTYDVFLSFRGKDTRYGFTGNLYNALCASGVYTFMDDEELPRGEEISQELPKAIEKSRISIVVFSEKYATSRWCLDDLVKIVDCKKLKQQMVLSIFFNVDVGEVRKQTGKFGRAMDKYLDEKGFKYEKVQRWREALTEAANLSGRPLCSSNDYEYKFIQSIVEEEVISKLERGALLHVAEYPVGIDSPLRKIDVLLQSASDDVRMLGICGLGGIGKTTIAKAVYNSLVHHFEGHASFLDNVRETSKRENGLVQLQNRLLSDMFGDGKWKVPNVDRGINMIKERLHGKKVLLILDDVDHLDQLEKLAVERKSFEKGSIVIITTRNEQLFTRDRFIKYEVEQLNSQETRQLFSWHAFKGNKSMVDCARVVDCAIGYADGHPLGLKVLGSYLNCFDTKREWESALDKCKKTQSVDIYKILKISFDGLDTSEKNIFLDIACFFKGENRDKVETMLKSGRFNPECGIATLIKRCLITVEHNQFWMHDLVQQMGREVARQESKEPKERSRLCFDEDNEEDLEVLREDMGLNKIQGIMLDFPEPKELDLSAKVFRMMKSLRVLIVRNAQFSEGFEYLPDQLRWLDWAYYHFPSPWNSFPEQLVVFNMSGSHIRLNEPLNKKFENMTHMDVSHCDFIVKLDILGMPNLKDLTASYCKNLLEVHQSVAFHDKLEYLDLSFCCNLQIFPSNLMMKSLDKLLLFYCLRLEKFPDILEGMESLTTLDLGYTSIKELPSSIQFLMRLKVLQLNECKNLTYLPSCIYELQDLYDIHLSNCSELELSWPSSVSYDSYSPSRFQMIRYLCLSNCNVSNLDFLTTHSCFLTLELLWLSGNNFVTIPECIQRFIKLNELVLDGCKQLREIPRLPRNIEFVEAMDCISLDSLSRKRLSSQRFFKNHHATTILPGSEIPKWFNHRSEGSSVSFCVGKEFPSYTFCVVLGLYDDQDQKIGEDVECKSYLSINGLRCVDSEVNEGIPYCVLYNSDHLVLKYVDLSSRGINNRHYLQNDMNYVKLSFEIEGPFEMNYFADQNFIKRCGVQVDFMCPPGVWWDDDDMDEEEDSGHRVSNNIGVLALPMETPLDTTLGIHVDEENDVESYYPQDRRLKVVNEYQGTNDKGKGVLDSSSVPYANTKHSALPGSEMGYRVSNNTAVLALPMETELATALGPLGWPYMGVQSTINDGLDARDQGWPPIVRDNTEHSPLPGSEMGHRVSNNTGVLALPMETTLETTLGVQPTVNDGFDLGASSMVDPFGNIGYDDSDFNGYPLEKRRRTS